MNFAYKRVSTEKQDLRRQEEAFKGINIDRVYCEKLIGSKADRPPREIPTSFKKYYPMWKAGDIAATDFARLFGVSRPTLYKYIK